MSLIRRRTQSLPVSHRLRWPLVIAIFVGVLVPVANGADPAPQADSPANNSADSVQPDFKTAPRKSTESISPQNPASLYQKTKPGFHRVPRTTEWEVLFNDDTQPAEYARQLDFFGIELAVVSKDGRLQYASLLSKGRPGRRSGTRDEEQRLSSSWKKGTLAEIDKKLLIKAGVSVGDKAILHYYPFVLEEELAALETAFAGRKPEEIRRTRFRVRDKVDKAHAYEFFVEEQDELKPGDLDSRAKPASTE